MPQSPFRHSTFESHSFNLVITHSIWDIGICLLPDYFYEKFGAVSISASPSLDAYLEYKPLDRREEHYHLVY